MEQTSIGEVELSYEVVGSGEPVLLIGTGPIADSFAPFVSATTMVSRHRLITYRQRRRTASSHGRAPVSFAQHAADAAALLGRLGVRRAHVAGHSTGAAIALQLAVDNPAMVHTLALLEPPMLGVPSVAAFFEKVAPALAAYGSGDAEGAMEGFLSAVCSMDWETCRALVEQHVPGGVAQAMADADEFFGSYLPALGAWQFGPEEAAGIRQPALSVVGTATERLFAEGHELLHAWLPNVEGCRIDGVAHLLHVQRPEPVVRCVAEFFARHPMVGDRRRRPSTAAIRGPRVSTRRP